MTVDHLGKARQPQLRITFNTATAGARALARPKALQSPLDCPPPRWAVAQQGFKRLVEDGWADRALEAGWTAEELFRLPPFWSQIAETGVAWLIGDWRTVEVTMRAITVETPSGARLKFRRAGEEHVAGSTGASTCRSSPPVLPRTKA
jgi:hypothetical protein